ncbi:MAG TPA: cupredoxin domain-containing protein [Xanthobacteraceae bacterium]|nr:cupredoxin domain-containing protein [Xanthobacteraceae bacterium]
MTKNTLIKPSSILVATLLVLSVGVARADDPVLLSLTIKDHQFEPAEVHAPAGKPITFAVKNLGSVAAEFESSALHFEKVIPAGGQAVVHVRPLEPGRYNFFDDFHRQTQGFLIVP